MISPCISASSIVKNNFANDMVSAQPGDRERSDVWGLRPARPARPCLYWRCECWARLSKHSFFFFFTKPQKSETDCRVSIRFPDANYRKLHQGHLERYNAAPDKFKDELKAASRSGAPTIGLTTSQSTPAPVHPRWRTERRNEQREVAADNASSASMSFFFFLARMMPSTAGNGDCLLDRNISPSARCLITF